MTPSNNGHVAVMAKVEWSGSQRREKQSISKRQCGNEYEVKKAKALYDGEVPVLLDKGVSQPVTWKGLYKTKELILDPRESTIFQLFGSFKRFWNRILDQMARQRTEMYRKARITGADEDKRAFKDLDKKKKTMIKMNKARMKKRLINHIEAANANELRHWYTRQNRHNEGASNVAQKAKELDLVAFIKILGTDVHDAWPAKDPKLGKTTALTMQWKVP